MGYPDAFLLLGENEIVSSRWSHASPVKRLTSFVSSGPASIVYDEGGNNELEDDRDSQDEISIVTSRYASRAPSMAPSRTHSMSNTPQVSHSPVEDHSAVGTQVSKSHSTSQPHGDRHPDGYAESSVSKKSKSSGSHSHPKPSSQQLSPNQSTVSHHTSRTERSQHSPRSSHHSASPREPPRHFSSPREVPHHSPLSRELSLHPASHPVSREPSQLGHQSGTATPTSTVHTHRRDREVPRSGPDPVDATPTPSQQSQSQQPTPSSSVLNDTSSSISRAHPRSKSIVPPTPPVEQTNFKFPSISTSGSPHETPVIRSVANSRKTSLTPSDSASNIHVNYFYGSGNAPGSNVGSVLPESTLSKKSKKDKNRSVLSTITSASRSTTKPPSEQPQPPEPTPPIPQISTPDSPAVSSSIGSSRLTTNPSTPITTRSLKPSLASSLSYVTDRSEQPPPPEPPVMSRQNSDTGSVIPGGLGSAIGGVLTGVWGAYKSASASPVMENPPPGPATAGFESTLETIHDVEIPGGFGGEREREAPVPPQEVIPEPVIISPSPPKPEEQELKVPTPQVEVADLPAPEPALPEPEPETAPQTPVEPEPSILSAADRKKAKKQRDKERKEREAQEQKEREEQERVEREEREAQEKKQREEREEKKKQDKAEREARKKKEREEREERERQEQEERAEKERIEREALEQAEREAKEQAEREAREQAEREAKEREKEAKELAKREAREAKERAEREAKEAQEQAEREAKEQAEKAAREKMDKVTRRRAEREAAKKAEQEAKEKAEREERERVEEAARAKAERSAKRKADREAKEQAEREAKEKAEQEARENAEQKARENAEKEAKEKAEREAKEQAEREEKERLEREREQERIEKERIEQERIEQERIETERIEREGKEKAEREANEKAEREAREREEEKKKTSASKIQSAWGSTVGKNDRSRKTSLSQKEQKNEWANTWDLGSAEKDNLPGLPPIFTSSNTGGLFDGAGNFDIFPSGQKNSPGGAEELELRTPQTKKGKKGISNLSNLSKAATPTETVDAGKPDVLEDLGLGDVSARVSVSSRSDNERWADAEQGLSPTEPTPPALAPEPGPEAFFSTSELLKTPKDVKDETLTTPKPLPTVSLTPARQSPIPTSSPTPAKIEPEKPLSLWERKKLKVTSPPAPASNLFSAGDGANSSGVWGDVAGGGNGEAIVMPALPGDRQSIFTDTARDQKRENQRENVVEGLLGSTPIRRRNDSAQSNMTTKPAPKVAPAPAPAPQKSSGWGSWGSSLLTNIASTIAVPDRSPSPEPSAVKPKIEDPPRGFTPSQPPKSQPAGFGSLNKPAWGVGGAGDNNAWGAAKTGPTPVVQKPSTGPVWGAKPASSAFGSGGTGWGSGTGPTFGSGAGKLLSVDTTTKPLESGPNTAGPENIPESAVEIKHVPAPGRFTSAITDKKEEAGGAQDDAWGWEEAGNKDSKNGSKVDSPVQEQAPEPQAEVTEEPAQTEETGTPVEDEFDWANTTKKKKGKVASVAQSPSVPNTPDPDNAEDAPGGGGGGGGGKGNKRKKKGKK